MISMIQAGPLTDNISVEVFNLKQDWHIKILHTDFTHCQNKYLST